jgi:nuclease HARBI1
MLNWYIIKKTNIPPLNVFGFIDGTFQWTCKPSYDQRAAFSGHKRCHGIKVQSIYSANGMFLCLQGPTAGLKHDSFMLAESNLLPQLQQMFPNNEFALYGVPEYSNSCVLWTGFRNPPAQSPEAHFNKRMLKVRVCVEWGFQTGTAVCRHVDFVPGMRIFVSPVAKHYITAVFIQNMHTCFYGNLTSRVFGCRAMDINKYIEMV